ncbi:hypothetical protein R1sor_022014 [Riccia sorocarpa]|uniref:Reverse transcriptase domain-containing protein n=1 Tax=Riccia sorocarpa TaxID=122646 RepID=A0ABD3GJC4_9MARC
MTNWARKLDVHIDSVQESGKKAILTVFTSHEEREKVLGCPHPPIRGCEVAHFAWEPSMDDENYLPPLKPIEVEVYNMPKWAKDIVPNIFNNMGQVIHIPYDSRELIKRDGRATILWDESIRLPSSIKVTLGPKSVTCRVRNISESEGGDSDIDDAEVEDLWRPRTEVKQRTPGGSTSMTEYKAPQNQKPDRDNLNRPRSMPKDDLHTERAQTVPLIDLSTTPSEQGEAPKSKATGQEAKYQPAFGQFRISSTPHYHAQQNRPEDNADSVLTPSWMKDSDTEQSSSSVQGGNHEVRKTLRVSKARRTRKETSQKTGGSRKEVGRMTVTPASDTRKEVMFLQGQGVNNNISVGDPLNDAGLMVTGLRYAIKNFVAKEKPDILALQETHLESEKLSFFLATMTAEYSVLASSSIGRSRGVALIYRKDLTLLQTGKDDARRFVWGRFSMGDHEFLVLSVYAPNDANERSQFWATLGPQLPQGRWFVGGDWNSVTTTADSSSTTNLQGSEEAIHFKAFCDTLGVMEAREWALKKEGPRYTRVQFRNGRMSWSRIDRLYFAEGRVDKVKHHSRYQTSDHLPASAFFHLNASTVDHRKQFMSAYFKADQYVVKENLQYLKLVWEELQTKYADGSAMDAFLRCWFGLRKEIKVLQYMKKERLLALPEKEKQLEALTRIPVTDLSLEQEKTLQVLTDESPGEIDKEVFTHYSNLYSWQQPPTGPRGGQGSPTLRLYFAAVLELWCSATPPAQFKDGLIFLLPKQGFTKGRSTHNCILTYSLTHEALKRERRAAFFISLDQEKAYDRLLPDYLWKVLETVGFTAPFINIVKALQVDVESRILLDGRLLAPFQVNNGVRQGCPLSPLLVVISTIPMINAIKRRNDSGEISAVQLPGGLRISCLCFADDLAVFLAIEKCSMENLFQLLRVVEITTGAEVNLIKSKLMLIGARTRFPTWARDVGIQLADPKEVSTYLGAPLATVWWGTDNGRDLLQKLKKKASFYSLPFESRILALKHGLFPTLIYTLLTTRFKKATLTSFNKIIREFIWSVDAEGKNKKSLTAWENLTLPGCWGGLGVFSSAEFQVALICRLTLKALLNLQQSLWAPILATSFLGTDSDHLRQALCMNPLPMSFSNAPVATLLVGSWSQFITLFNWKPTDSDWLPAGDLRGLLFLTFRRRLRSDVRGG